jgi:hypothetical protein
MAQLHNDGVAVAMIDPTPWFRTILLYRAEEVTAGKVVSAVN